MSTPPATFEQHQQATVDLVRKFHELPIAMHPLIGQRVHHKCTYVDCPIFGIVKTAWHFPMVSNSGRFAEWWFEVETEPYTAKLTGEPIPQIKSIFGDYSIEPAPRSVAS